MLERQLFAHFIHLYRPFITELNARLAPYQLFNAQYRMMRIMYHRQDMTFQEIAKASFIERPSASNLIHKLIALGYVGTREGQDKRNKHVFLTDEGKRIYLEVDELINQMVVPLLLNVSDEDKQTVIRVFEQIEQNLKAR